MSHCAITSKTPTPSSTEHSKPAVGRKVSLPAEIQWHIIDIVLLGSYERMRAGEAQGVQTYTNILLKVAVTSASYRKRIRPHIHGKAEELLSYFKSSIDSARSSLRQRPSLQTYQSVLDLFRALGLSTYLKWLGAIVQGYELHRSEVEKDIQLMRKNRDITALKAEIETLKAENRFNNQALCEANAKLQGSARRVEELEKANAALREQIQIASD